jgi:hypothetical protein
MKWNPWAPEGRCRVRDRLVIPAPTPQPNDFTAFGVAVGHQPVTHPESRLSTGKNKTDIAVQQFDVSAFTRSQRSSPLAASLAYLDAN